MAAPDTSVDWAAWVQAVGSVLALFLTGGLAWWETRQRRREDGERAADLLRSRVAILRYAEEALVGFLDVQRSDRRMNQVRADAPYKETLFALEQVSQVRVSDMPTPLAVRRFFFVSKECSALCNRLKRLEPRWLEPQEVTALDGRLATIARAIGEIEGEASRLEHAS